MASVDFTPRVLQWAPRSPWKVIPFDPALAPLVASWATTLEDLRWVAPCTPPPLDGPKVLEWHRSYVEPYILNDPAGIPVGYGELVPSQTRIDDIWIAHLVVDPRRRNEGIGGRFVQAFLDKCFQEMGARSVFLSVFEDNASGRACYRRAGFRESGARKLRPVWLTEEEPLVDMRIERFDWLARRWKEALAEATQGADWKKYYRMYRRLRLYGDHHLPERLDVMLQSIPDNATGDLQIADFGCGPGMLAEDMARHFPRATVWAFDADPLVVLMGEQVLRSEFGDRIRFELADLRDTAWGFGRQEQFVLGASALSLHWMSRDSLRRFYHTAASTIMPHGVLANSDHVPVESGWSSALFSIASASHHRNTLPEQKTVACLPWAAFWNRVKSELGVDSLCEQMASELPVYEGLEQGQNYRLHQLAMRNAGFSIVREMWRHEGEAVIIAYK